jgi:hypothetical protein
MKSAALAIVLALLSVTACTSPPICQAITRASLAVGAADSITSAPIPNATITADGVGFAFHNEGSTGPTAATVNLSSDIGTFNLTAQAPGYKPWSRQVTTTASDDACPLPDLLTVIARLQPLP